MFTSAKPWFKKDDKHVIFTANYMEVFIPEYYIEKGASEMIGNHFRTLGILNFKIYSDDKNKKIIKEGVFNLPIELVKYPSYFRDEELELVKGRGTGKYTVLEYYKGDIFCSSVSPANTETFSLCLNIVIGGKLPNTIPYDSILELWDNSFIQNGANYDIPDLIKELIIGQIYRDSKNPMNTFGSRLAKDPKANQYDYLAMSPRELTSSKSIFNGIIFEDMDRMLTSGIITSKKNKEQVISPMEKVMKY